MLIEILAIIGVVLFVIGFTIILWRKKRKAIEAAFADETDDADTEAEQGDTPEDQADGEKKNEIFAAVDTSNKQDATGYGYDAAGESVVKNMSFEEKLGKDTVVVEVPAPRTRKKAKAAPAKVVTSVKKGKPVHLGATPEELVKILERKIVRRVDVLKVAKLPESGDATLKRYRASLEDLKSKIAASAPAKPAKGTRKAKSSTEDADVLVVTTPAVTKKAARKTAKPAKKAPAKKLAKKATKKATKKSK